MESKPENKSGTESGMEAENVPTTKDKNEAKDEPSLFPTAPTAKKGMLAKTTIELDMISLSQEIRERERWMDIVNKDSTPECLQKIKDKKMVEYIIDELKYYASLCTGGIEIGAIDGTWQADNLIDPKLKKDFSKYIQDNLETVDESQKDYHPWSRRVVVDLSHPSLFCYVDGVTKVNPLDDKLDNIQAEVEPEVSSGKDNVNDPEEEEEEEKKPANPLNESGDLEENFGRYIFRYQWLPSEFHVDEEGKVFINSYINNLDPTKHSALYTMIGQIFEKFIPLFNNVLTDLLNVRENRIIVKSEWSKDSNKQKIVDKPEIPKFAPPEVKSERVDLKGRNLQVIVKLANVELTPKEPNFSGGMWHVEGMSTEAIVATGVYFYSSSNVTQSRLSFRQGIEIPDHSPGDAKGVRELYDLERGSILSQQLGSIVCSEDRCIAYPNIYQHKVNDFSLKDKTKNGHRKILAFLLVEPNKRVMSTKHVAPQSGEWGDKAKLDPTRKPVMSLEEARKFRENLMISRKYDPTKDLYEFDMRHSFYERKFVLNEGKLPDLNESK